MTSATVRTVAISGSSGLIGGALATSLAGEGIAVRRLVRRRPSAGGDIQWDPDRGTIDAQALEGVDAVVHLAGAPIAERWTDAQKKRIRESRVQGTRLLASTIAKLRKQPAVMVSGSAIGIYGSRRGDELLDERSSTGGDFLADVSREWEAAAEPASAAGVRVVYTRTGLVLSPDGGVLGKMLLPFRLGAGGRIGSGRQWFSWIALDDAVQGLSFMMREAALRGPVNLVAPHPVTNAEFTDAVGRVLARPTFATVPAIAIRLALGEMGEHTVLASQRVMPQRLLEAGYRFRHPRIEEALRIELERGRARSG